MMGTPRLCWGWLCPLALLLAGCVTSGMPDAAEEHHAEVGLAIQAVYEEALPSLPADKQRHYAQRLYRLTGEARYLPVIRRHALQLATQLEREIGTLAEPDGPRRLVRRSLEHYPRRTPKQRARAEMLAGWDDIAYAHDLLLRLAQAEYYGMLDDVSGHELALDYLASVDWATFLSDPQVLDIYAAQVANQAHFLHQLGVMDLRHAVESAFRQRYPPERVASLPTEEYHNWLYGLTHFVIAESRYYQQQVDTEAYGWVLAAFTADAERIMREASEDILAEVALSFLLAGCEEHPLVGRIRAALVAAVDPASEVIPSPRGGTGLADGEHRNVLAIMVLRWTGRLYPGPYIY